MIYSIIQFFLIIKNDENVLCFAVSKKKKKNRFGGLSRNKTAPSPYDDEGTDSDHRDPRDYRSRDLREPTPSSRGNSIALGWKDDPVTPGSRGFRASRSPRLEPLEEPEYELESHCKYKVDGIYPWKNDFLATTK